MDKVRADLINHFKEIIHEFTNIQLNWHYQDGKIKDEFIISEAVPKEDAMQYAEDLNTIFDSNLVSLKESNKPSQPNLCEIIIPTELAMERSPEFMLKKLFMYLSRSDLDRLEKVPMFKKYIEEYKAEELHNFSQDNKETFEKALQYLNKYQRGKEKWQYLQIEPNPSQANEVIVTRKSAISNDNEAVILSYKDIYEFAKRELQWESEHLTWH